MSPSDLLPGPERGANGVLVATDGIENAPREATKSKQRWGADVTVVAVISGKRFKGNERRSRCRIDRKHGYLKLQKKYLQQYQS